MKIVHFSNNSLAGMPHRLVRSLAAHTDHEVRLVDLERYGLEKLGWFHYDLVFRENMDECVALAESAEIIHLHNFLDLKSTEFSPIDFAALVKRGIPVVRQFHSEPGVVAERMGRPLADVLECTLPQLVIGHCPERFYPRARVVPNFLPQDDPAYMPVDAAPQYDIFFSPSKMYGAWETRWATKGAPEVVEMLTRLASDTGCRVKWLNGSPLDEVLAAKQASRVIIDDLVTGSTHLSGLEGLCQGKSVLCHLDERMAEVLRHLSGASWHPFLNVRLEEAEPVLRHLLAHPEEAEAMGRESRRWVEEHWADHRLVRHFEEAYAILAADPARLGRQDELTLGGTLRRFKAGRLPDLIHGRRAEIGRG
ncbi:MAG: glycosyltransferase family 1 protein [Proteobacteria bacterium]|nr:glycosyltransferase family 1 protein [Pseudomonadota bacterium]MBU1611329.1 glycosyltransferase family 1 protein [Pseudomonadota bacterium]